jgi:hypothetical protein
MDQRDFALTSFESFLKLPVEDHHRRSRYQDAARGKTVAALFYFVFFISGSIRLSAQAADPSLSHGSTNADSNSVSAITTDPHSSTSAQDTTAPRVEATEPAIDAAPAMNDSSTGDASPNSEAGAPTEGYVWVLSADATMTKLQPNGTAVLTGVGVVSNASTQGGVATDAAGNVWSVTPTADILDFSNSGSTGVGDYGGSGSSNTGGLSAPAAVAVDGGGQVWVANSGNNSVSLFTNAGTVISPQTGMTGYQDSSYGKPSGITVDVSGNVWVTNASTNSVTEVLGAAVPVEPVATALTDSSTGARP